MMVEIAKSYLTPRLRLVPATVAALEAESHEKFDELARLLSAQVPTQWPPSLYDNDWRRRVLRKLSASPDHAEWWVWYFLLRSQKDNELPVLIGAGGFKGPPEHGVVEIGYSILEEFQRQGLATEAAGGLVQWALGQPGIHTVLAHTLPTLRASIRVLEKNGFVQRGEPAESDTIRFEFHT